MASGDVAYSELDDALMNLNEQINSLDELSKRINGGPSLSRSSSINDRTLTSSCSVDSSFSGYESNTSTLKGSTHFSNQGIITAYSCKATATLVNNNNNIIDKSLHSTMLTSNDSLSFNPRWSSFSYMDSNSTTNSVLNSSFTGSTCDKTLTDSGHSSVSGSVNTSPIGSTGNDSALNGLSTGTTTVLIHKRRPAMENGRDSQSSDSDYMSGYEDVSLGVLGQTANRSSFSSLESPLDTSPSTSTCNASGMYEDIQINFQPKSRHTIHEAIDGLAFALSRSVSMPTPFPNGTGSQSAPLPATDEANVQNYFSYSSLPPWISTANVQPLSQQWQIQMNRQASGMIAVEGKRKTTLNIYCEDCRAVAITVDENTSAQQLTYLLILKLKCEDDVNWTVMECLGNRLAMPCPPLAHVWIDCSLNFLTINFQKTIQRCIEDHEKVLAVVDSWMMPFDNRLMFRKDTRKYDPFRHPERIFPKHMMDTKSDTGKISDVAGMTKMLLMKNLVVSSDRIPDLQGTLYVKEEGKNSWRKTFSLLRGSGLYFSTKGKSKEPQNLRCLSRLNNVNIYVATNVERKWKAPRQHCIVLKSCRDRTPREWRCICAKDVDRLMSWLAAIRIAKYGRILRENYTRTAMRCDTSTNSLPRPKKTAR